jgi:hypothetical protein
MAFFMIEDELPYPGEVGLFGAERVMEVAQGLAVLVEQFFAWNRC